MTAGDDVERAGSPRRRLWWASVTGGNGNTASGHSASVAGGRFGTVAGDYDSRIGNTDFPD